MNLNRRFSQLTCVLALLTGCGQAEVVGVNPPPPATPVAPGIYISEVIDPCGDAPGIIDEVLLLLSDSSILVLFTNNKHGKNPRLSVLPAGDYMTSDGSNCRFSVTANGVENEHY